ncbi:MAG: DUF3578 domain-containing protein [Porticoccaceae bacterium]|nr:DUF3578 domain-containing protein [Porticoccaceae bacterium]
MIKNIILEFVEKWPDEKQFAKTELSKNKQANAELRTRLEAEGREKEYSNLKATFPLGSLDTASLIENQIPSEVAALANLPKSEYRLKGSIGQGVPADIPWICVFDQSITTSAQNGYYIVYLFDAELKGIYLSLGLGWTQYEHTYGVKQGKIEIGKSVKISQKLLRSTQGFSKNQINLGSTGNLAKGYEAGVMLNKYYPISNLPDDSEFVDVLRNLIGVYKELKGLVGKEIIEIAGAADEDLFQEEIQAPQSGKTPKGKLAPKNKIGGTQGSKRPRSLVSSFEALETANFLCENDSNHETFISARSGHQFVEAHHLIPMEFQDNYEYSIDVPENIISLCPNCHRRFHNAENDVKSKIVEKFWERRHHHLRSNRGIRANLTELLAYYLK